MRNILCSLVFLSVNIALFAVDRPAIILPSETAKIESLLTFIGSQTAIKFIRNGRDYDSSTAVRFLRGKWDSKKTKVGTAREFIDQIARQSSTTGQPYLIRMPDGQEIDCATFLSNRLNEIETK